MTGASYAEEAKVAGSPTSAYSNNGVARTTARTGAARSSTSTTSSARGVAGSTGADVIARATQAEQPTLGSSTSTTSAEREVAGATARTTPIPGAELFVRATQAKEPARSTTSTNAAIRNDEAVLVSGVTVVMELKTSTANLMEASTCGTSTASLFDADHASMATAVALFCRRGLQPTPPCCKRLVYFVDRAGICCLSTEPDLILARLNASSVLALYTACGGRHAKKLIAACQGTSSPGVVIGPTHGRFLSSTGARVTTIIAQSAPSAPLPSPLARKTKCDTAHLGRAILSNCDISTHVQSPACCSAILETVDTGCLCPVAEESSFVLNMPLETVWRSYSFCGGRRTTVPRDMNRCSAPPSSPPASAPTPPPPSHRNLSRTAVLSSLLAWYVLVYIYGGYYLVGEIRMRWTTLKASGGIGIQLIRRW